MSSVKDILSKTNQQVDLLNEERKMQYATEMAGWKGWWLGLTRQIGVPNFKTIIEGKRLLSKKEGKHE